MRNYSRFLLLLTCITFFCSDLIKSQPSVAAYKAFNGTRILNAQSDQTLRKNILDFRITHKFGDLAGKNGGVESFFGVDDAADIRLAFEYGLTNRLMIGLGRSKGTKHVKSIIDGMIKFRLLEQSIDNKMPLSVVLFANTGFSYMKKTTDSTKVSNFPKFVHRFSFTYQMILSRKFGDRFSLALLPTYSHRNFVPFGDQNGLFFIGAGFRFVFAKGFAFVADYFQPIEQILLDSPTYRPPLAVGIEYETGGHVFLLNFSNNKGILENEFLPYSESDWLDGEFRIGFTISRKIRL